MYPLYSKALTFSIPAVDSFLILYNSKQLDETGRTLTKERANNRMSNKIVKTAPSLIIRDAGVLMYVTYVNSYIFPPCIKCIAKSL